MAGIYGNIDEKVNLRMLIFCFLKKFLKSCHSCSIHFVIIVEWEIRKRFPTGGDSGSYYISGTERRRSENHMILGVRKKMMKDK